MFYTVLSKLGLYFPESPSLLGSGNNYKNKGRLEGIYDGMMSHHKASEKQ